MTIQNVAMTVSLLALVDIPKHRFVGFDGGIAAAGTKPKGISEVDTAKDEVCPVNTHGDLLIVAGGAIARGAEVEVGADGKAIAKASGVGVGYASDTATADGDMIRVLI